VPFKLTSSSSTHAVFENKDNDFPRRLEYRLRKKNKLNVTVSDGAKRSVVTPFSKVEPPQPKTKRTQSIAPELRAARILKSTSFAAAR